MRTRLGVVDDALLDVFWANDLSRVSPVGTENPRWLKHRRAARPSFNHLGGRQVLLGQVRVPCDPDYLADYDLALQLTRRMFPHAFDPDWDDEAD